MKSIIIRPFHFPSFFFLLSLFSRATSFTAVSTMTISNGDKKDHILNHITPKEVAIEIKDPVDASALAQAKAILKELREKEGETYAVTGAVRSSKLLEIGKRLGDVGQDATAYLVSSEACKKAYEDLAEDHRTALVNIHNRVKAFAEAQRATITDMEMDIPGGKAGHTVSPCKGSYFLTAFQLVVFSGENPCLSFGPHLSFYYSFLSH
jgi:Histidinol dehydrogenase